MDGLTSFNKIEPEPQVHDCSIFGKIEHMPDASGFTISPKRDKFAIDLSPITKQRDAQ